MDDQRFHRWQRSRRAILTRRDPANERPEDFDGLYVLADENRSPLLALS